MRIIPNFVMGSVTLVALPCALGLFGCHSDVPRPPSADQTCFGLVSESNDTHYCDAQACFPKSFAITNLSGIGFGFQCDANTGSCAKPGGSGGLGLGNPQNYIYRDGSNTVELSFSNNILVDGYSLENFKKYALGGEVWAQVDPAYEPFIGSGVMEVVAYDQGVLHVRFTAKAEYTNSTIATPPYSCQTQSEVSWPTICTTARCSYDDYTSGADPVQISVDLNLPIAPPAP